MALSKLTCFNDCKKTFENDWLAVDLSFVAVVADNFENKKSEE
jgi:hypothetical protein